MAKISHLSKNKISMEFIFGVLACVFIYTTVLIILCLVITQSWIFLFFIILNVLVFLILGILYMKKSLLIQLIGKPLASFLNKDTMKNLFCKVKDWI